MLGENEGESYNSSMEKNERILPPPFHVFQIRPYNSPLPEH
jgi:hypothetical protein